MNHRIASENQTARHVPPIACAAVLAVVFVGTPTHTVRAQPGAGEAMRVNAKTGKCLTFAAGVSEENNVEALQFDCDSDPSRRWVLRAMGGDIYQIRNARTAVAAIAALDAGGLPSCRCDASMDDRPLQHNAQMLPRRARSPASEFDRVEQAGT
jgi:hypothetical protein